MTRWPVGLLDTNVVIAFEQVPEEMLPETSVISTITLAELSIGPLVATTEQERAARQVRLQGVEAGFDPLPFDAAAARAFARVAASLRRSGRKPSARAYDALIAAVALANDLPLFTLDAGDFSGIDGLQVIAIAPRPR